MEADYILLCNGIQISRYQKKIDGGVVIKGSEIICVGTRKEIAKYLGLETLVIEFSNGYLITFRTDSESCEDHTVANIAVFANGRRTKRTEITKMVNLRFLMYRGEVIFQKGI